MPAKIDLIGGDTRRCLLGMALPMIAAMFLNLMYNLVDSLWIGNLLGETAYAALTGSTPIVLMLTSAAMGVTSGVSILLSQAVGAKDTARTEGLIATSFVMTAAFSLLVTAGLELSLPLALRALGTPAQTLRMARDYLAIYALGYLPSTLYLYFAAVLRSFGNSLFQAAAMLTMTVLNAVLDPILIRAVGFHGAAAATLLSQVVSLAAMALYLRRKRLFALRLSRFTPAHIPALIQKAVPSVIQQSIPAVSTAFLTALVSGCGIPALAAYGVAGKLETILFYPAMALNMVLTAIVGQCAGANRPDRARDYVRCALRCGCLALALLSLGVVLSAGRLSRLFVRSAQVEAVVSAYFSIVGVGYVLNTATNCFLGALSGMGKPSRSMLLMAFYYILIRMPLAWLLARLGFGLRGIFAAVLVSHVAACAAAAAAGTLALRRARR